MSEEVTSATRKVKKAAQMLLFQRHKIPGVKGWELKRALGREYLNIIELLNTELEKLGLQVKIVYEELETPKTPSEEQLDKARFFVTLKTPLTVTEATMSGWRIDDVAILAVTVAYIISKQGKASRKEVIQILKEKFPQWKIEFNLDRYIRRGYLSQDENEILYLDWRARAEIDPKALLNLILGETRSQAVEAVTKRDQSPPQT
ncbi:MAG: hypothetical protein QXW18_05000 [Candidatus Bathyarchaeia archaeon]